MTKRYLVGMITVAVVALAGQTAFAKLPSWDTVNNAKGRFTILNAFNKEAVLDKETGLVWEMSPSTTPSPSWYAANSACVTRVINNRMGWRLPTIQELTSLVDENTASPALPPNHPFVDIAGIYWSATSRVDPGLGQDSAWSVGMNDGVAAPVEKTQALLRHWCVRGQTSSGTDEQ